MQHVNGVPVHSSDPSLFFEGLDVEPTWFSAQGGVYRCSHRKTHQQVAIKKYLVEENRHKDMFVMPKELVENEIYTMTKCIHPNILKLLAVHLHEEFVYLIMPLCTGGSLQQYVFEHHLSVGQLAHIVQAVASGLAEVHNHGYIHRDIKCDNIFLDSDTNTIVIGDFGVVSITPTADSKVEEAGVVLFWSPELVQQRIVNHKIDIWALGIVILEILNGGRAPYEDEKLDEEEIKQRILDNGKPTYPDGIPSRLVDLLDRCLEQDPQQRATANDILQHAFLRHYEPESLFPVQDDASSQCDLEHTVEAQEGMDDDVMANALKKLKALQALHDFTLDLPSLDRPKQEQASPVTASATSPPPTAVPIATRATRQPARMPRHIPSSTQKCRLPLPAFVIDKDQALAIPAPERVANVLRKRQSMTEASRNQGSRLPVLMLPAPSIHTVTEEPNPPPKKALPVPKVKADPSPRTKASPSPSPKRLAAPLARAKSPFKPSTNLPTSHTPASQEAHAKRRTERTRPRATSNHPTNGSGPVETPKSPRPALSHRHELRPPPPTADPSSHTKLRIPQTRTARLSLGISTNGHCYSNKDLGHVTDAKRSPGIRRTTPTASEKVAQDREKKPRPASFAGNSSGKGADSASKRIPPLSPRWQSMTQSRRQSAPVPAKDGAGLGKTSALKGAKALRVH